MPEEYFEKLLNLLEVERVEDLKLYDNLSNSSGLSERRLEGLAWYPVAIRGTEITKGDYLAVEVERTTHTDLSHQFRHGANVALFSNHDKSVDRLEGTVSYLSNNTLKISLRVDELPDWIRNGKLGVDLLFDDNSYREMQAALEKARMISENKEEGYIVKVLTGKVDASFESQKLYAIPSMLNESQKSAVRKIIDARELAIVHGPPGTGKTTTIVEGIDALIKSGSTKILVVAPSNAAVDLLTEKIFEKGIPVVRIGNPARVSEKLSALTLDGKIAEHANIKQVRQLKRQASEYRDMAHKYKRNFGRAEQEQRKALFSEAHRILKDAAAIESFVADDVLQKARVITATLVGANHYSIRKIQYDSVIIDEAGQALEPACWIPLLKARKVVLAGDHCQLPPTIKSEQAAKAGLSKTLFEKCVDLHPAAVVLLEEQYRMNTAIMRYSSEVFYDGRLKANEEVAKRLVAEGEPALEFVDTAGCGFEEEQEGTSTKNVEEASLLLKHLESLMIRVQDLPDIDRPPSIAIISPYKQQIAVLKDQIVSFPALATYPGKISIDTVDSFQGQERDVVYISLTRSNNNSSIGFLSDIRRMNVAMTRARKKLVVVGDSATLASHPFYAGFIAYAEGLNSYKSAWEFME